MTEDRTMKERLKRLKEIYRSLPDNMQELAFPMIENLTFIESQMNRLQKQIEQEGLTEEYQNGSNQKGMKQSASIQTYNSLMKNYVSIYSKLEKMLSHVKEDNKSKLENFKKMIDDE